ncbi:hypothetical protein [Psychrobacillus phage Perkons]|nr:hypothetical protein [Psychrobacillus phage Perkons]
MYNSYELMWLWYYYHAEKVDLLVGDVVSENDEDCKIPITSYSRKVSHDHVRNLRKIMHGICGGYSGELNKYKNTFSHYKNKRIFEEYEYLNRQGDFNFIDKYVNDKLAPKTQANYEIFILD